VIASLRRPDLLQLVIAPVRTRDIFVARLMTAVTANLLLSFILAAGHGNRRRRGGPWFFYPMALLLIAVQVLVVTALQAILMTVILRWCRRRWPRRAAAVRASPAPPCTWRGTQPEKDLWRQGALTSRTSPLSFSASTGCHHVARARAQRNLQGSATGALVWLLATVALAASSSHSGTSV